ncbi:MAG TPA: DUF1697 domain-containing protein [Ktedonobacteraceae bacterium]|nr:DUF1697 domain-containing protein [Ktedonobacteraceae bacterium]
MLKIIMFEYYFVQGEQNRQGRGAKMTAFVSLFRGINVGGHHHIRMDDLKEMHEALGFKDAFPYIQSGNVVFTSDDADAARLRGRIEDGFEKKFGFHVEVIVRTSAELREIIEQNPFQSHQSIESKWVVVMFLAARPDATAQEDLLKTYTGPEELFITGKEVYIYYPNGIGRSKLSNSFIEKKLKIVGTARNWNTILQLQKLLQR